MQVNKGAQQGHHVDHSGGHVDLPEALVHVLVVVGAPELGVLGSTEVANLLPNGFASLEVVLLVHQAQHWRGEVEPHDQLQRGAESEADELEDDQRVPAADVG